MNPWGTQLVCLLACFVDVPAKKWSKTNDLANAVPSNESNLQSNYAFVSGSFGLLCGDGSCCLHTYQ